MSLKAGYSRKTITDNIGLLMREGYPRTQAIVAALNLARKSYFTRYPAGLLPLALAYPKTHRLARFYLDSGAPIRQHVPSREVNPVKELDIGVEELAQIQQNVQQQMSDQGGAVRKAAALYTDFTGHDDPQLTKIAIPSIPVAALAIGQVDGIMYTTVRDGQTEKYIHRFKRSSRPLMISSPDGKQLYLIGGSYDFTERGIVDK